jgi:hypothetical protein
VIEDEGKLNDFQIPALNGLPIGVDQTLPSIDAPPFKYLAPYSFYNQHPFFGNVPTSVPGFPGFNPQKPHDLLNFANQGLIKSGAKFKKMTVLSFDSELSSGGISNTPFVVKQANASSLKATFWIQEIEDGKGKKQLRMQYLQVILLSFFPRLDGFPGLIRWPHVSINTLTKASK